MRPVVMTALRDDLRRAAGRVRRRSGCETRQPMAVATAAGMFPSTLLSRLLVVPVFYLALDDAEAQLRWRDHARSDGNRARGAARGHAPPLAGARSRVFAP
jgi:hypothetical protein